MGRATCLVWLGLLGCDAVAPEDAALARVGVDDTALGVSAFEPGLDPLAAVGGPSPALHPTGGSAGTAAAPTGPTVLLPPEPPVLVAERVGLPVVAVGSAVTFDASATTDRNGDPLDFTWSVVRRPLGAAAVLQGDRTSVAELTVDLPGTYEVEVEVDDGAFVVSQRLSVTASDAPVAQGGNDLVQVVGDVVTLDGSASYDPDGDDLEWFWRILTRPPGSTAALSGASVPSEADVVSFVADVSGVYVVELRVSDGTTTSQPDLVAISVTLP